MEVCDVSVFSSRKHPQWAISGLPLASVSQFQNDMRWLEVNNSDHWIIKLGIQTDGRSKSFKVLFSYSHNCTLVNGAVSILSAKFDCPVARQDFSLLATAHDCRTDL